MTSGSNFWDVDIWSFVLVMTILFCGMMLANILRRSIGFLRRSMIPSSVLGGFIILLINFIYGKITGGSLYDVATLEALTYHGLGLGFVAMSLKSADKPKDGTHGRDIFNAGLTTVGGYLIQGVLGLAVTIGLSYAINCFAASGIILPLGYGQGPGQAYNWGSIYESQYSFEHGTSFGLTVAAMGFVAASIGGVVYLAVMRKKGKFSGETGKDYIDEGLSAETITGKGEIPLSESMDKLTIQFALIFIGYIMAYGFMRLVNAAIDADLLGAFGHNTVKPLIWGFNFLFGCVFAIVLKKILGLGKKTGIIKREYTNNFMLSRIAGFMFDIMVVASIAAIDLSAFTYKEFIIPLVIICIIGAGATYFYLDFVCKKLYPTYRDEMWLVMYGMLTGTASTGIILLREADPRFETPAATNLVYQQLWAIVFGFPMLLMLGVAPQGMNKTWLTLGVLAVLFVAINIILFRTFIFKKKEKETNENINNNTQSRV